MQPTPIGRDASTLLDLRRVLVIDADPAFTRAVQRVLRAAGYLVVECNDPRDALVAIVRGEEFDLILCNWGLPHVPAGDFHDQVAAMSPTLAARIVFMGPEIQASGLTNAQILMPFTPEQLRGWVAEYVGLRTLPPRHRGV